MTEAEPTYLGPVELVVETNGDDLKDALNNRGHGAAHLGVVTLKLISIHWEDTRADRRIHGNPSSEQHVENQFEIHKIIHEVIRYNSIYFADSRDLQSKNELRAFGAFQGTIESSIFPEGSTLDYDKAWLRIWHPDDIGLQEQVKGTLQVAMWLPNPERQ